MKLIIQIPCYNEEDNLAKVIDELPTRIKGIDKIEYMVINDGSTDNTRNIAVDKKVHYIIDIPKNRGLANAFMIGINECLKKGADIIVNIDGDHQYSGHDIEKLINPIIEKNADMVIGERQIDKFPFFKRILQRFGSFIIRLLSRTKVPDAPSGFRAYSREYALKLDVYNNFTYTLETIIQAGSIGAKIETVKITSYQNTRKSRLFKNSAEYIYKSCANVTKALFIYKPIKMWAFLSFVSLCLTLLMYAIPNINTIIKATCIIITVQFAIVSIISIPIQSNRKLLERLRYNEKKQLYDKKG